MRALQRIDSSQVDSERTLAFPLVMLRRGPVLPLKADDNETDTLPVAVPESGRWPWELMDDLRRELAMEIEPVLAPADEILAGLNRVFDMASVSASEMLEGLEDEPDFEKEIGEIADLLDGDEEAPVIRLVNTLIGQALKERASDIHIEPFEKQVLVRFRVDGVLYTVVTPPKSVQSAISTRIKVMAGLDIAEKRHPQDGRFAVRIAGRQVDVRVSVLPTAFGERIVMRLLDRSRKLLTLQELGMNDAQLECMRQAIASPHGIVLVTGPTGSGKSTTLYASLLQMDRTDRNILTIEDPVEYQLEHVGQMQVQPKIGLTFASGLRSILRQDPDIIMIGEIRDLETAEIAIQASLTGHMVLSTLHTNDALSAIVRLRDMGVDAYLIASSLAMVQAQRLVRKLCPDCKQCRPPQGDELSALELSQGVKVETVCEPVGCDSCLHTGYKGRIGIFEMVPVSEPLRQVIHDGAGLPKLRQLAKQEGMLSLRQDGARHVAAGETSIDEVLRVTRSDEVVVQL